MCAVTSRSSCTFRSKISRLFSTRCHPDRVRRLFWRTTRDLLLLSPGYVAAAFRPADSPFVAPVYTELASAGECAQTPYRSLPLALSHPRKLSLFAILRRGVEVYFPSRALSTDNAAGYARFANGLHEDATLNAEANLPLA
jgi:hypothetical protein